MADRLCERTFDYQSVPVLTALRAAPESEAEQVSEVVPGEPVQVEETRAGWARVRTAYDYSGWLRTDSLVGKSDRAWLDPRVPEPLVHARALVGAPYRWGGMTAHGIDCSGLVHMSFRAAGRLVPRDADQQEKAGVRVEAPQPGDLISYGDERAADHVAFWLGEGRILHATGRSGVRCVLEEAEPDELRKRRRSAFRL